jgi:large subunit ribosomal protein L23
MNSERLYTVLLGPHISEKAAISADESNQFVFDVVIDANKLEVKKAVEKLFNVKVSKVQVLKTKGKVKRNKFGYAKRPDAKKAVVRLAEGHDIDFTAAD